MSPLVKIEQSAFGIFRKPHLSRLFIGALVISARKSSRFSVSARIGNCPAGKAAGNFLDVLERIAAVDAERMKLHNFTGIVFINATLLALLALFGSLFHLFDSLVKLFISQPLILLESLTRRRIIH